MDSQSNPGEEYARQLDVNVGDLHQKILNAIKAGKYPLFTTEELQVMRACIEVAYGF